MDLALLPEWGNSIMYEARIIIPKGQTIHVGFAAPQIIKSIGTVLPGGAEQVILPLDWPLKWIDSIRRIPSK